MSRRLLGSFVALALVACGGHEEEAAAPQPNVAPSAPQAVPAPVAPPAAPAEARELWEDPSFELRANLAGPYAPGQEGRFEVRLTPRGEYHVNAQYPMSIRLTGPAQVAFPKVELNAEDAAELGEPLARFQVPFNANAAGQHRITAEVDFAVCTPQSCMPDTRTLAVVLPVGE